MSARLSLRQGLLAVSVAAVMSAAAFGVYVALSGSEIGGNFWQNVVAEFLAAALAIGIGIPVGIMLNELAHRDEVGRQDGTDREMRRQTLVSLQSELDEALQWLSQIKPDNIIFPGPSSLRWEAASEAGNLRLLEPSMLHALARAYHFLHEAYSAHFRFMDARVGPASAIHIGGKSAVEVAAEDVVTVSEMALEPVESALKTITAELEAKEPPDAK